MLEEKYLAVKDHIYRNRAAYISGGVCAALSAGFTILIMKGRYEGLGNAGPYGLKTADTSVTMRPFTFLSNQKNVKNVVKVIARDGRGHPGYIIRSLDTQEVFSSQREAASVFGISETLLSKHLSGKIVDAEGHRFERIRLNA